MCCIYALCGYLCRRPYQVCRTSPIPLLHSASVAWTLGSAANICNKVGWPTTGVVILYSVCGQSHLHTRHMMTCRSVAYHFELSILRLSTPMQAPWAGGHVELYIQSYVIYGCADFGALRKAVDNEWHMALSHVSEPQRSSSEINQVDIIHHTSRDLDFRKERDNLVLRSFQPHALFDSTPCSLTSDVADIVEINTVRQVRIPSTPHCFKSTPAAL